MDRLSFIHCKIKTNINTSAFYPFIMNFSFIHHEIQFESFPSERLKEKIDEKKKTEMQNLTKNRLFEMFIRIAHTVIGRV